MDKLPEPVHGWITITEAGRRRQIQCEAYEAGSRRWAWTTEPVDGQYRSFTLSLVGGKWHDDGDGRTWAEVELARLNAGEEFTLWTDPHAGDWDSL